MKDNLVWDEPIDDKDLDKEIDEYGITYYKKGTLIRHRTNGPAVIYSDGLEFWKQNNVDHRVDGPSRDYYENNEKEWWYKGKKINCSSQQEFEKLIKLKVFW